METYESVKSNPVQPEQKEKKKGGAWKGIVAVILAAGVVGSTTISASAVTEPPGLLIYS